MSDDNENQVTQDGWYNRKYIGDKLFDGNRGVIVHESGDIYQHGHFVGSIHDDPFLQDYGKEPGGIWPFWPSFESTPATASTLPSGPAYRAGPVDALRAFFIPAAMAAAAYMGFQALVRAPHPADAESASRVAAQSRAAEVDAAAIEQADIAKIRQTPRYRRVQARWPNEQQADIALMQQEIDLLDDLNIQNSRSDPHLHGHNGVMPHIGTEGVLRVPVNGQWRSADPMNINPTSGQAFNLCTLYSGPGGHCSGEPGRDGLGPVLRGVDGYFVGLVTSGCAEDLVADTEACRRAMNFLDLPPGAQAAD